MVFQNERCEYLFAERMKNDEHTTYYTLCNRNGEIIRSGEIQIELDTFVDSQKKAGFREVDFC